MGAQSFMVNIAGVSTLREAFQQAVSAAQWEHGHGGYTGSIAEKDDVREVFPPQADWTVTQKTKWASDLLDEVGTSDDLQWINDWINDKWGPAAALRLGPDSWLFFGCASS